MIRPSWLQRTTPKRTLIAITVFVVLMVGLPALMGLIVTEEAYEANKQLLLYLSMLLPLVAAGISLVIGYRPFRPFAWRQWLLKPQKGTEKRPWEMLLFLPLLFIGVFMIQFALEFVLVSIFGDLFLADASLLNDFLSPSGIGQGIVMFIIIVFLAPVLEEYVMRGTVFRSLRLRHGFMMSAVLSALMFGLLHGFMSQVPFAFISGFVLAWLYEVTNDLRYPIAFHILNNGIIFTLSLAIESLLQVT